MWFANMIRWNDEVNPRKAEQTFEKMEFYGPRQQASVISKMLISCFFVDIV